MEDALVDASKGTCNHEKQEWYNERCFDVLNGFELTFIHCLNCHKIVSLEAKKFEDR